MEFGDNTYRIGKTKLNGQVKEGIGIKTDEATARKIFTEALELLDGGNDWDTVVDYIYVKSQELQ